MQIIISIPNLWSEYLMMLDAKGQTEICALNTFFQLVLQYFYHLNLRINSTIWGIFPFPLMHKRGSLHLFGFATSEIQQWVRRAAHLQCHFWTVQTASRWGLKFYMLATEKLPVALKDARDYVVKNLSTGIISFAWAARFMFVHRFLHLAVSAPAYLWCLDTALL